MRGARKRGPQIPDEFAVVIPPILPNFFLPLSALLHLKELSKPYQTHRGSSSKTWRHVEGQTADEVL